MRRSVERLTWESAPEILTVDETAILARIPRNAAYEAVRLGLIPSVNLGSRRIRVSKAALAKVFALPVETKAPTDVFSPSET